MLDENSQQVPNCLIGTTKTGGPASLPLKMANRHGLILGATGTGKTVTVQTLAEGFSKAGVSVFVADVKGDLSGLAALQDNTKSEQLPVRFLDVFGKQGHPLTISLQEMGPVLLARVLDLTEAQEGALAIAFRLARQNSQKISDLQTLRILLSQVETRHEEIVQEMGSAPVSSLNAIRRRLLVLEEEGATGQFSSNGFDVKSLMVRKGTFGQITVLSSDRLVRNPKSYAFTLMYLLEALARDLDEVGDLDKPRLVFFFDEAHLLFRNASPIFLEKIEQVVRLIRSKGVGIFFATQHPGDIPDRILAQLSHKCIHALRCFTASDRRAVSAIAHGLIAPKRMDIAQEISQLGVGEVIFSSLAADGRPTTAVQIKVKAPSSRIGPITAAEREAINGPIVSSGTTRRHSHLQTKNCSRLSSKSRSYILGERAGNFLASLLQNTKT